jgi:metal-sulfur cluster biosynthetic enzyme
MFKKLISRLKPVGSRRDRSGAEPVPKKDMDEEMDIKDPYAFLKQEVRDLLLQVRDPEVGLDIINMGLVYRVDFQKESNTILVTMTLTSQGCPMGPMITQNVSEVLQQYYPDKDIHIHLVWEPKWSTEMITEQGKQELGWG